MEEVHGAVADREHGHQRERDQLDPGEQGGHGRPPSSPFRSESSPPVTGSRMSWSGLPDVVGLPTLGAAGVPGSVAGAEVLVPSSRFNMSTSSSMVPYRPAKSPLIVESPLLGNGNVAIRPSES